MWSAQLSRREFFELCLGSPKVLEGRVRSTSAIGFSFGEESSLHLYWEQNPLERFTMPSLVVVPDNGLPDVLSAVVAAPQTPSPISAFSRFLTREEAQHQFDTDMLPFNDSVLPALTTLAMVESVLHGDGRLGIRQLTPMICKRTLSYAWGRAICARSGPDAFVELPRRWLDAYGMINSDGATASAERTIEALINVLSVVTQVSMGLRPESSSGVMAYALLHGNQQEQETAWRVLARGIDRFVPIELLLSSTREERGSYLQQALQHITPLGSGQGTIAADDEIAAACAFIATRVAPGSLEHFDVLRSSQNSALLAWYGLYATLQSPREVMALQGSLGFRVLRDVERVEDKLSAPSADIAFAELKTFDRVGFDTIANKLGHANEIQIELVPFVTATFTFQAKRRDRFGTHPQQQEFGLEERDYRVSAKVRLSRLASDLAMLIKELPDSPISEDNYPSARRVRKK